jgi:hypothetical protein
MELMVAASISTVVLAMSGAFLAMSARTTAGIVQQTTINTQAGRTSQFIFDRVRFATSMTNDGAGNTLTLGFDDNPDADSDGDKTTYNDKNHYEIIQFLNGDGNDATTKDNRLITYARTNSTFGQTNVLLQSAIGKLPGRNIFVVTNQTTTVLLNYLLVDSYATDGYQSCAVSTDFVARNRPDPSAVIKILP